MDKHQRRTNKSKKSKRMMMTTRAKKLKSRSHKISYKSKSKSKNKNKKGGAPASYVGSIQGEFINNKGQQLFRNPVGGIA
jgi:hypothetical protein